MDFRWGNRGTERVKSRGVHAGHVTRVPASHRALLQRRGGHPLCRGEAERVEAVALPTQGLVVELPPLHM